MLRLIAPCRRPRFLPSLQSSGVVLGLVVAAVSTIASSSAIASDDDWLLRGPDVRVTGRAALVGPESAADVLAMPGLVILDVRDPDAHDNERIRGSVLLDDGAWKRWSLDESIAMHEPDAWRSEAARHGVDGTHPVLLLDDGSMTRAPRIWFILNRLAIRDVMVADGGLPAWRDAIGDERLTCGDVGRGPGPDASSAGDPSSAVPAPASRSRTTSSPAPIRWLDRVDMLRLLGDGRVQLVDVRSDAEFDGTKPLKNPRGGHLPGAVVLPHKALLAKDGRVRSSRDVHDILSAHGVDPTRPIVVYCQSGARATLAALALARSGVDALACYYEGFGSWSMDDRCPVVVD